MLVIDSNVFVSTLGKPDNFTCESQKFFKNLNSDIEIILPSLVVMETKVAIFKQNPLTLKPMTKYFQGFNIVPLDAQFINSAIRSLQKDILLKSSDLIIALTAKMHQATLVTWDNNLIRYANKLCPVVTPVMYTAEKAIAALKPKNIIPGEKREKIYSQYLNKRHGKSL